MILTTFLTMFVKIFFELFYASHRCFDRGFKCDDHHTKQLTQYDYEQKNMGSEFEIDVNYSSMVTFVCVTMFYAG